MSLRLCLVASLFVACGTVRTPFSSGPDEHIGEIACHGVLLPAKSAPRAFFLCSGDRAACEASKNEQTAKGYTVSDCALQPRAACLPTDDAQICLGSLGECRDFATVASRDPSTCVAYAAESGEHEGAFSGAYTSTLGDVAVLRTGNVVRIRYAAGSLQCTIDKTAASCTWRTEDSSSRKGTWAAASTPTSDVTIQAVSFSRPSARRWAVSFPRATS